MNDPMTRLELELVKLGWEPVAFGCARLRGDGFDGTKAVVWMRISGRGGWVYPWTERRYLVKPIKIRRGSPRTAALAIHDAVNVQPPAA